MCIKKKIITTLILICLMLSACNKNEDISNDTEEVVDIAVEDLGTTGEVTEYVEQDYEEIDLSYETYQLLVEEYYNNGLYVNDERGNFYCLTPDNQFASEVEPMIFKVFGDFPAAYMCYYKDFVYGIDTNTGNVFSFNTKTLTFDSTQLELSLNSMLLYNNTLYMCEAENNYVYYWNLETLDSGVYIDMPISNPVIYDDMLVFESVQDGRLLYVPLIDSVENKKLVVGELKDDSECIRKEGDQYKISLMAGVEGIEPTISLDEYHTLELGSSYPERISKNPNSTMACIEADETGFYYGQKDFKTVEDYMASEYGVVSRWFSDQNIENGRVRVYERWDGSSYGLKYYPTEIWGMESVLDIEYTISPDAKIYFIEELPKIERGFLPIYGEGLPIAQVFEEESITSNNLQGMGIERKWRGVYSVRLVLNEQNEVVAIYERMIAG